MNTVPVSIAVECNKSTADLHLHIFLDEVELWSGGFTDKLKHTVTLDIDDTPGKHIFGISLVGKKPEHTVLEDGKIVDDLYITISELKVDGIDITKLLLKHSAYIHNYNNTGEFTMESFYGTMGCDGIVGLSYESPMDFWVLQNL